ncbi:glutamate--cysteine ligase [Microbispora sp. NBRC 16548]|uniref:carboxylate-amine ligase n=1 Tax=Microbispora sp. NBRC 16548 TaxID=3030994 RepID=UPI0024A49C36|nr:glutamate--cysteine ligase [Microbispora sp. NBRC 16548]GLX08824.1 putative glutamate--cysteine ligase 2-3 [Microbispora sp. NBRC 16548]
MPDVTREVQFDTVHGPSLVAQATASSATLTLGVEEEFLLADPRTGRVAPAAREIRERAAGPGADRLVFELTQFQLESNTAVHTSLRDLHGDLLEMRRAAACAAANAGLALVACGTALDGNEGVPPLSSCPRYQAMLREFGAIMEGQGVCGCHVHVGIADREEAVRVSNHLRPWLPVLQALAANSPISDGRDTGYASWRALMMGRWPSAEPPPFFRSVEHYESLVAGMLAGGTILDRKMIYWLVRPSDHVPTLEIRAADVCPTAGETVLLAGLVRGLAETALRDVRAGVPAPEVEDTLLRAAYWRAARDGVDGEALDLLAGAGVSMGRVPAWRLVDRLLEYVRPVLEENGDWTPLTDQLERVRRSGSGAARQRAAYARRGRLCDVVELLMAQTAASCWA